MNRALARVLGLFLALASGYASAAPALFFSDLDSGPRTGNGDTSQGQTAGTHGAVVTVWGKGLGTSQGASTVTIGGVAAAKVYYWGNAVAPWDNADLFASHGYQVIVAQVASTAAVGAGTIQATVGGTASTTVPFTVRTTGNIRFIAPGGSNAAAGTYTAPWLDQTVLTGSGKMAPGDIAYIRTGTYLTADTTDPYLIFTKSSENCTAALPCAVTAYPGETPTLGNASTPKGINSSLGSNYWTFAKLKMRGSISAFEYINGNGKRIVGNDAGGFLTSTYGPLEFQNCNDCKVLGNHVYNTGPGGPEAKLGHLIYYGGFGNNAGVEIAWNHLYQAHGGRGIQVYGHVANESLTGLSIHDNVIYDNRLEGIIVGRSDGGNAGWITGDVPIYNNVLYRNGLGNTYSPGEGSGIRLSGTGANWKVYNNTLFGNKNNIWHEGSLSAAIRNNILASPTNVQVSYMDNAGGTVTYANNLFVGGAPPAQDTGAITASSAGFVNSASTPPDLHLLSTSAAKDTGTSSVSSVTPRDIDGVARPQDAGYDIGAYEFDTATPPPAPDTTAPTAPTSLTGTPTSTQVTLNWVASTDAVGVTGYFIDRCTGVSCTGFVALAGPITGTTYINTGLTPSTTYVYRVRATDAAGNLSSWSSSYSVATTAGAAGGTVLVDPKFFGMHTSAATLQPWPTSPFGTWRLHDQYPGIKWADTNSAAGVYNWTQLDAVVAAGEAKGVDIVYAFVMTPVWASTNPTGTGCAYGNGTCYAPNLTDWNAFVTAVTARYAGRIKYWQLWNEPNAGNFWSGTTAEMVAMAQSAYPIIKAAHASHIVLSPSPQDIDSHTWLDGYFTAGGVPYTDVITFHSYMYNQAPERLNQLVTDIKAVQAAHAGLAGKPIWDTEHSWGDDTWPTWGASEDNQTAWLARHMALSVSNGIARSIWYMYHGWTAQQHAGWLWNNDTASLRKPGVAYNQVHNWLNGATMTTPCVLTGTVYKCDITKPGGYVGSIVWASSVVPTDTAAYTVPASVLRYRTLDGTTVATTAGASLTLTMKPILLENVVTAGGGTGSGWSPPSTTVTTQPIPPATPPTVPTGLTAVVNSPTQITVSWNAATDDVAVTAYYLEACAGPVPCTRFLPVIRTPLLTYVHKALKPITPYTYRVRATDE